MLSNSNRFFNETKAQLRIDVMNHGYNAMIDCKPSTFFYPYVGTSWRGRPALLVNKDYPGNVDLLLKNCNDDFSDAIYSVVEKGKE